MVNGRQGSLSKLLATCLELPLSNHRARLILVHDN